MDKANWTTREVEGAAAQTIAETLHLPRPLAALLVCRGIDTVDEAQRFLHPALEQMHSPLLMLGMDTAVRRVRAALIAGEPILIYGDYDVDGTIATVLLKTALQRAATMLGAAADVRYHVPHRIREGYGMTEARIEAAAAEGVRLVISVDTGIRAFAAAETAQRCGLDLVVTDHHLPDAAQGVPSAVAVLNPNQPGDRYPFKELCGAGVAYKLAQAVLEDCAPDEQARLRLREKTLPSFLKLLSIATIADSVSLTGENRVIASIGLRELQSPAQPGLRALMELAQIDPATPISATDVGFRLAPRINAAGRMDIADSVVEMFLARDAAEARALAETLHRLNNERRATEAEALRAIEDRLESMSADGLAACLVLDDETWHRGVIGILASRVVDRTGRPALVLAHDDGQAYGSGRSVAGFHLLDALTAVHTQEEAVLFNRFGGHAYAVGFSLPSDRVATLRERMERHAAGAVPGPAAGPEVECDTELRFSELTEGFFAAYERLGPFGQGNPEPVFLTRGVRLASAWRPVKDRHLRVAFEETADGARLGGMAWARRLDWVGIAREQQWTQGDLFDVAYRLSRNRHPDFGGWEMEIVAMQRVAANAA